MYFTSTTKIQRGILMSCVFVVLFTSSLFFLPTQASATQHFTKNPVSHSTNGAGIGNIDDDCIIKCPIRAITRFFKNMAGWTLGASGIFFDMAIEFSLNSDNFKNGAVETGWGVFRDIANMTFIFILVYIAFNAILQLGGNYQRMLVTLVIVALLVNFSFFLSGLVVDASNILSAFLYNALTNNGTIGLAAQFKDGLELTSLLSPEGFNNLTNTQAATFYILASIFLLIAAFVFLASAILFVTRSVAITLLLVLSPIAFASAILDRTQTYWKLWFDRLLDYSFVAPIYLLLIFTTLAIIKGGGAKANAIALQKNTDGGDFAGDALASGLGYAGKSGYSFENYAGIIMFFALIIGLLIASLIISKKLAGSLADMSVKYAGKAVGVAAGIGGFAGRQVVGRGSYALSQNKALQKAAEKSGVGGYAARAALRTVDYGAGASYDVRSSGTIRSALGNTVGGALAAGGMQVNTGRAGGKGGFSSELDKKTKEISKRADVFKSKEAKEQYAKNLEFASSSLVMSARKAAADKIRKGKDKKDKIIDLARELAKDEEKAEGSEKKGAIEEENKLFPTLE